MEITPTHSESQRGPAEWFTGEVWLDSIASLPEPSRLRALSVHFSPGARTAWHRHPFGQILIVTEGNGLVQRKGEPVERISAGDTVRFEADEEQWHGAAPNGFMSHIALQEADDDGVPAYWGEQVTDEEYLANSQDA